MSEENSPGSLSPALAARVLVRRAFKASLATLTPDSGAPYVSLVAMATDTRGRPVMLLSGLAVHSRNLQADGRASLLVDGTDGLGDPLAGGRLTITGTVKRVADDGVRRRFLARHPAAGAYVDFGDFAFYLLEPSGGHLIEGFGRIWRLPAEDLLTAAEAADRFSAEADDLSPDLNALCSIAGVESRAGWRVCGVDAEGVDLAEGPRALRLLFPQAVSSPSDARAQFGRLKLS